MDIKKVNWEIILLSAILIFAVFIRVYSLGNPPLWIDESISAEASKNILEKGMPVFDSGLLYDRAYVFHYLQAFFLLFSQSEFFARLVSVIFGILTVVLAYLIGKEYSKSGGIFCALFMSVFFLEVFFSRQARFYQMFQFMFFLSLYLLYKSRLKEKYLYFAIIAMFLAYDTQIQALILAPFFILHILLWNKKKWLAVFPLILLVLKLMPVLGLAPALSSGVDSSTESLFINYASEYFDYASNMNYMLILFVPGLIWSFAKKKRFTLLLILPSLAALIGTFSLQTFALRYIYVFVFPLVLFSSLLLSFTYERYGKILLIAAMALLILPSNMFFPYTYVNVLKPIDYNMNDESAPETNYKLIPQNLAAEIRASDAALISLFSLDAEFYLRKPDYAIPFSMDGRGNDQISYNSSDGRAVDRYSGAEMLDYSNLPDLPYYITADWFSVSKLKGEQRENFKELTENCLEKYSANDLKIYYCE